MIFFFFLFFINIKNIGYYFFFKITPFGQKYNTIFLYWWFMEY